MNRRLFDTEKLIVEVQKRPGIFDKSLANYHDKKLKEKLWEEIYEVMVPNWKELDENERYAKAKDIQGKWKNLRDSFRKELNLQNSLSPGSVCREKRKYLYFDKLLFLLPTSEVQKTSSNYRPTEVCDAERFSGEAIQRDNNLETPYTTHSANNQMGKKTTFEEFLLQVVQESKQAEIDEDKAFLLSLIPTFKKMSIQQKFQAKIDILRTLQSITALPSIYSTTQPHRPNIPNPDLQTTGITPSTNYQGPPFLQYPTQHAFLQIAPIFHSSLSAQGTTQPIDNQAITFPSQNSSSTLCEPPATVPASAPGSPKIFCISSDSEFVEFQG